MRDAQVNGLRLASAIGAVAAGLGSQTSDAAVIYQAVDVDVPANANPYAVNFDGGVTEFEITAGTTTVTKIATLAPTTAVVFDPIDNRTANLALGTLIGPGSAFGPDGAAPNGGDALNGTDAGNPVGHFQATDPAGFIGVRFQIAGATHYGYVGYEGIGDVADGEGHVYALGYEDAPDTAIAAGAGIPEPTSLSLLAAGAVGLSSYRRRSA